MTTPTSLIPSDIAAALTCSGALTIGAGSLVLIQFSEDKSSATSNIYILMMAAGFLGLSGEIICRMSSAYIPTAIGKTMIAAAVATMAVEYTALMTLSIMTGKDILGIQITLATMAVGTLLVAAGEALGPNKRNAKAPRPPRNDHSAKLV